MDPIDEYSFDIMAAMLCGKLHLPKPLEPASWQSTGTCFLVKIDLQWN